VDGNTCQNGKCEYACQIKQFAGSDHKYHYCGQKNMDWFTAKKHCEDLGGYLGTIADFQENDFIDE